MCVLVIQVNVFRLWGTFSLWLMLRTHSSLSCSYITPSKPNWCLWYEPTTWMKTEYVSPLPPSEAKISQTQTTPSSSRALRAGGSRAHGLRFLTVQPLCFFSGQKDYSCKSWALVVWKMSNDLLKLQWSEKTPKHLTPKQASTWQKANLAGHMKLLAKSP